MTKYEFLVCPAEELTVTPFFYPHCATPPVFLPITYELPPLLQYFGLRSIVYTKFQLHACVFVIFASFIAPFGGFFASGFKRAFEIKVSISFRILFIPA